MISLLFNHLSKKRGVKSRDFISGAVYLFELTLRIGIIDTLNARSPNPYEKRNFFQSIGQKTTGNNRILLNHK